MATLAELSQILDALADQLNVKRLEQHVIQAYHETIGKKIVKELIAACKQLRETYKPSHAHDFPVLAVFAETFNSQATPYGMWNCRCCSVPFPVGHFSEMNCGCVWEYCYECGHCGKHCHCRKMTQLSDSKVWKNVMDCVDSSLKQAFIKAVTSEDAPITNKSKPSKPLPDLPNVAWEQARRHYESRGFKIWRRGEREPKGDR